MRGEGRGGEGGRRTQEADEEVMREGGASFCKMMLQQISCLSLCYWLQFLFQMSAKLLTLQQQQLDSSWSNEVDGAATRSGEVNTNTTSEGRSAEQLWEVIR